MTTEPLTVREKELMARLAEVERKFKSTYPANQKFPPGTRVRVADDLGEGYWHFRSGVNATVEYTYAGRYGGDDVHSYFLKVDGHGSCGWYHESHLTEIGG